MAEQPAPSRSTSAAVIGGGPAGLVAALALAHFDVPTVLVARRPTRIDNRTTALMGPSVAALEALGVWPQCRAHAAPLRVMRIADDTGRLWRAPEVRFEAAEIGLEAFGWNIENTHLVAALWERIAAMPALMHVEAEAQAIDIDEGGVTVTLGSGATASSPSPLVGEGRGGGSGGCGADAPHTPTPTPDPSPAEPGYSRGSATQQSDRSRQQPTSVRGGEKRGDSGALRCRLAIGADGRNSMCRTAAGIALDSRTYPQTALTFTLAHTRPHHDISTEFHTAHGPFTLVPLPGMRSSLVCVVATEEAARLGALGGAALDAEIERRSHSILGKTRVEPGHGAFPMAVATAREFAANRVALVGEAAHVFPPIGAQGLNLGLRDAVTIAEIAGELHRSGRDIGEATGEYDRRRRADIKSRIVAVDLLNRSLLSDFLAVQGLRGLGLYVIDRIGPLRRAVMREGVAPRAAMPALMRAEPGP